MAVASGAPPLDSRRRKPQRGRAQVLQIFPPPRTEPLSRVDTSRCQTAMSTMSQLTARN